jgi:DNA-binding transcriptional LysR family regulator
MDLRQLEYFVAVAEEANFTRAAERAHVSQSGVSAQVRQLERELGATLFDRSTRTVALTSAGAAALGPARQALAAAGAVRRAVDEVAELVRGSLRVGMVTGCTVVPLFEALASFHQAHPGVELALEEGNSASLVEEVRAGAIDLALVGVAGSPPTGLEAEVLVSEGLVALVPPDHPLGGRPTATLAELAGHPLVCLPAGTGIRAVLDGALERAGLRADVVLEASAPEAVTDLAVRGFGAAVLSASMAPGAAGGPVAVALTDVDEPALLALVWRAGPHPALRKLLAHARASFGRG